MVRTALYCASIAAFGALAFSSADAFACGGFFCGGSGPQQVNQAAERIIFAEHGDGSVTAIVQIMYSGPSDRFAWILPVPGIPEVGLSSNVAFSALQNATNPQFQMNTTVEGECAPNDQFASPTANGADAGVAEGNNVANNTNNSGVTVVDRGSAGPYDYVVIQIDGAAGDKSQLALDWLTENNFQVTDVGPDLLAPYLDENYNLLAVRLQKSSDAGAIRPLRLKYETEHPMIPIKLTAVAANEDMGVMTWLLGSSRAVPVNYKALEINDALINWFNPTSNYNDVVIAAANEASGQGFVTEYADTTADLGQVVFTTFDEEQWEFLNTRDWSNERAAMLDATMSNYVWSQNGMWDGVREAFEKAMPNVSSEDIDTLLGCGAYCIWDSGNMPDFEPAVLLAALDEFVVAPMRDTQELMDEFSYVTRMYTTLSAHEMTLDPSFDYNPDLAEVSNVHIAERIIECHPDILQQDAPWRVELPSGLLVRGTGNSWPIVQDEMMPATLSVSEIGTSGPGTVVRDNLQIIQDLLATANAIVPTREEMAGTNPVGKRRDRPSNCSSVGATSVLSPLLVFAFIGWRRRRRSTTQVPS